MTREVYQFDIRRAGRVADLHQMTGDIRKNVTLDQTERDELFELIRQKFFHLNHAAGRIRNPDSKPCALERTSTLIVIHK